MHQNPTKAQVADARARTGDEGDPRKDPDYLIEDHVFDCYSPTPAKAVRGVWTEVSKKIDKRQTQRVVVHLKDWQGDLGALQRQFDDWPVHGLKELVVVTADRQVLQMVPRH